MRASCVQLRAERYAFATIGLDTRDPLCAAMAGLCRPADGRQRLHLTPGGRTPARRSRIVPFTTRSPSYDRGDDRGDHRAAPYIRCTGVDSRLRLLVADGAAIESALSVAARIDGSESAAVDDQLARRFQSPFAHSVVLVATGIPSPQRARRPGVRALVDSLQAIRGVTRVLSYLDGREPLFAATRSEAQMPRS